MQQACTIGIDIGTTSVKAVAFTKEGLQLGKTSRRLTLWHPEDGYAEQDVVHVYDAVLQALAELLPQVNEKGYTMSAVGFSAAMHSLFAVDEAGVPLNRALTWMDSRANAEAEALWSSAEGPTIYERTGTPIHPMSPLAKLIWMRSHTPDVFAGAHKFVSIKEWIWYQWFGVWEIDASMASATGLYDLDSGQWHEGALRRAGVAAAQLSGIVPTTHTRTGLAEERMLSMGLSRDTPFNIGATDGVLANLGAAGVDSDAMVFTIGTSCAVRRDTTQIHTDVQTRSFCYVLATDRYVVGGPSNSGGILVDWLYRSVIGGPGASVNEDGLTSMLEKAATEESQSLFCLPYVSGERAPLWNADANASFIGLQVHHSGLHLLRAAVEGILFNAYWIASRVFEKTGTPTRLIASGRLLEVPWVAQLAADIFGLPVEVTSSGDASTIGAVVLAEVATGQLQWSEVGKRLASFETVGAAHPVAPKAVQREYYRHKYSRFRELTRTLGLDKSADAAGSGAGHQYSRV